MSQPQEMPRDPEQTETNLRLLIEQHWLHCRHIENERVTFMSIYAGITGGIITYAFGQKLIQLWPIYFIMVFTLIAFLLAWRWKLAFDHHQKEAIRTAKGLGVLLDLEVKPDWKKFGTSFLFIYFYAIILIGLIIIVINH